MAMKATMYACPNTDRKPVRGAQFIAPSDPKERFEVSIRLRRKAYSGTVAKDRHLSHRELGDA